MAINKSIIDFPDNYCIIDIETTGLDKNFDDIIEVAAIKVRNNVIVDTFQEFVNPGREVDEFILSLTHIKQEWLDTAEYAEDIIPKYLDFISDDIIIGHNVGFDMGFLKYKDKEYVNTIRLAHKAFPGLETYALSELCSNLNIHSSNFHRALGDCEATLELYNQIKQSISDYDEFKCLFKRPSHAPSYKMSDFEININADSTNPLYGKKCVVTGKLERATRKQALEIIAHCGGEPLSTVTSKTDILIIGNLDYIKAEKSTKQKKAEALISDGNSITILSENAFYDFIETE